MPDLIEWLRAQLDEDERIARAAMEPSPGWSDTGEDEHWHRNERYIEGPGIMIYDEGGHTDAQAEHIAAHDPARVLAEVAAKRAILDLHRPVPNARQRREAVDEPDPALRNYLLGDGATPDVCTICQPAAAPGSYPCQTVRALAQPYAGRAGWQDEWAL